MEFKMLSTKKYKPSFLIKNMKALIPSHREKKRYLLLRGKNLKEEVQKAIKDFVGILGLSEASPRWVKKDILSINRKSLDKIKASFAIHNKKIEVLKISGTLKGLKINKVFKNNSK